MMLFTNNLVLCNNFWIDNSVDMDILKKAWIYPGGGGGNRPYYSLQINGEFLRGERDWLIRWSALQEMKPIIEKKKVLELGCNMGLHSIFFTKYWNCTCVGLDCPDNKLAEKGTPELIKSATFAQEAFGVKFPIHQLNLDSDNYESVLGTNFDIVICFSVLFWVSEKDKLMRYLSKFKHVIFEGHHSNEQEINNFKKFGFMNYKIIAATQIGVSHPIENTRTIIYFWK